MTEAEGSDVNERVGLLKKPRERGRVVHVASDGRHGRRKVSTGERGPHERRHLVPPPQELGHHASAREPGRARHGDPHTTLPFRALRS